MQPTDIRRVVELLRNDYVIKVCTCCMALILVQHMVHAVSLH